METKEPNIFIRDDNPPWNECESLEEWVLRALREGRDEEAIKLIRTLPEVSRAKYRELWKREKEGKKNG